MNKKYIFFVVVLFFAAEVALPHAVQSGTIYNFTNNGFDEGAMVTGFFEASDDSPANGQISSFDGEVTDFGMSFDGNSLVPAFTLDFSSLVGLVWDIGSSILGDGILLDVEGIWAEDALFAYVVGAGPLSNPPPVGLTFDATTGNTAETPAFAEVANPVPEPATIILLGIGLAGLVGGAARRKRKNKVVGNS